MFNRMVFSPSLQMNIEHAITVGNTGKERGKLMMVRGASKARRDYMEMLVVF